MGTTKAQLVAQAQELGLDTKGTKKDLEERIQEAQAPAAPPVAFEKPQPVTPTVRKGSSTCDNPVGTTWVTCMAITHNANGHLQARKVYTKAAIEAGVTYYTARTQVNRYLGWVRGGCDPNDLPRGVVVGAGLLLGHVDN